MQEKLDANSLYDRIYSIEVRDRYARQEKVFNNVTEMLIKPNKFNVVARCCCDEKYKFNKLSDFEMFSVWERAYHLCAGMGEARLYKEEMAALGLDAPSFDASDKLLCERWKAANAALTDDCFDVSVKNYDTVYLNKFVSDFVISRRNSNASFDDAFSELISSAKAINSKRIHVIFNALDMRYERPDAYHAQVRFEALKNDEKYNDDFVVYSQLIVGLANELKDRKICLHMYSEHGYDTVKALVSYIFDHTAFDGEIRLGVFADSFADTWLDICHGQIKHAVTPELLLRTRDLGIGLCDHLMRLFERYPVGCMRFGGTLDAPMPTAAHVILKKSLAEYLSHACDEAFAAYNVLERFFEDE